MKKKYFIILIIITFIFIFGDKINANDIDTYLKDTKLVNASGDMNIEVGIKNQILIWVKNIGGFLGLATVGAIVYGSLKMVISGGEEEKLKKAKDIIKWAILGFLGVVLAGGIITIIVEFMYTF